MSKATVLIVDDLAANREILHDFVLSQGYGPILAADGSAALEILADRSVDVMLLDILMPGMDGYGVLEHMKVDERLCHIPVVVISAVDEQDSVVRCIERGADDYIVKPFNPVMLRARLSACLERKRLHDREAQLFKELNESYAQLKRAEATRDSLVHMIVHDINKPLMSITLNIKMIKAGMARGGIDGDEIMRRVSLMEEPAARVQAMAADILDVSKMESDGLDVRLQPVPVARLTASVAEESGIRAEAAEKRLVLGEISDELVAAADEALLRRVVQNLLANAFKYVPAGGEVRLSATDGERIELRVQDNGPGIPEELRGRIFDKFSQGELRAGQERRGVGLGLAFCKMASEAMGGRIWVESGEGAGATFVVQLRTWPSDQAGVGAP